MPPKLISENTGSVRQVASLVTRLLNHYWTANEPEEVRRAQVEDWIEDLVQFGPEVVSRACGRWRLTQNRRPTPADIVKLAIEERDQLGIEEEGPAPGKKKYGQMSEAEKRAWHTDVYAFRRVCLGIFEQTSPPDPTGKWYDPIMVEEAARTTKRQLEAKRQQNREAFARGAGWSSAQEREDAIRAQKQRELDGDWNHPERSRERTAPPAAGFKTLAEALGVTATPMEDPNDAHQAE